MENVEIKEKKRKSFRPQTLGEEIGNAITHGLGFIFGLVALILLLVKSNTPQEYVGCSIFGFGMMMLYLSSCLYHSFKNDTKVKRVFKKFDHLSIYLLIGGTFAPILLCVIEWPLGLVFFIIQWVIITIGIVLKSINSKKFHILHVVLYLLLGWSGLFFIGELISTDINLFLFILYGGIAYSLGVIFYVTQFKYSHFIWHFFCVFGTVFQFIAIYAYVL